jgi:hypothetical protein
MLWILQTTIISILLIFLVHHLIVFFKSMLTVPKIKDLVNNPKQTYDNIYKTIKKPNNLTNNLTNNLIDEPNINTNEYTMIDLLPKKETNDSMKNELKDFLKKQLYKPDTMNNY